MWVAWSGVAASGITVVNATSITANTPYVGGTLDVTVETPSGMVRLANVYTAAYAVGQIVKVVATMNGAVPGLIAAEEDLSDAQNGVWIRWGPELTIGSGAQSESDGAANTREIVLKATGDMAAQGCTSYAAGGFNDWFLPAMDQLNALWDNQSAIGVFRSNFYWRSTEGTLVDKSQIATAKARRFDTGVMTEVNKTNYLHVRCVRQYTP